MKLYTSAVVAKWLGLSERRVRQLRDEGIIEERAPGLYDLQPTVTRYILYMRKGSGKTDLTDERALLTKAKREAAEMENALRRGTLHSTEDIEKGLKAMVLKIRSRLMLLPAKLSPTLSSMGGNQAGIFDEMKAAIDEALEELSDYRVTMAVDEEQEEEENGLYEQRIGDVQEDNEQQDSEQNA